MRTAGSPIHHGMIDDPDTKAPLDDVRGFLAECLGIELAALPRPGEWAEGGNTIGAIGLRLNLLGLDELDAILERQEAESSLFGEIAVKLGYLSEEQVERILELQHLHRTLALCEMLFVAGRIDLPRLLESLASFFRSHEGMPG